MKLTDKLKAKARSLTTELAALSLSFKDPRTPLHAKIMVWLAVGYAFSPIDLIPDFIPILGYLDDLIILPLMIVITIRLIPKEVMDECRVKASLAVSGKST